MTICKFAAVTNYCNSQQIVYKLAYSKIYSCITKPLNVNLHLKPYQLQLYNSASYMKHLNREELLSFISPYSIYLTNTINIKAL